MLCEMHVDFGTWIEVYFPELEKKGRLLILYRVENIQSRGSNVLLDFENILSVFWLYQFGCVALREMSCFVKVA